MNPKPSKSLKRRRLAQTKRKERLKRTITFSRSTGSSMVVDTRDITHVMATNENGERVLRSIKRVKADIATNQST